MTHIHTRSEQNSAPELARARTQAEERTLSPRLVAVIGNQDSGKSTLVHGLIRSQLEREREKESSDKSGKAAQSGSEPLLRTKAASGAPRSTGVTLDGLFGTQVFRMPQNIEGNGEFILMDCPGQPESLDESLAMTSCADLTIVVIDPHPENIVKIAPTLALLAEKHIPHCIVVNKIDSTEFNLDALLPSLQRYCPESLLLQQFPLHEKNGVQEIFGLVQLWDETTVRLRRDHKGEMTAALAQDAALESACARQEFLESLANYDDALLSDLLEERLPTIQAIADDLRDTLKNDSVVPVFLTSAATGLGISQLARTLDAVCVSRVAELLTSVGQEARPGHGETQTPLAVVTHNGEIPRRGHALCGRVLRGQVTAGIYLGDARIQEVLEFKPDGTLERTDALTCGNVFVALTAQQQARGTIIGTEQSDLHLPLHTLDASPYAQALVLNAHKAPSDKIIQAVDQICSENPSLAKSFGSSDAHELILWAPGPVQFAAARAALRERLGSDLEFKDPTVPLREKILEKHEKVQGRYKHQNGGHGAFGDVIMSFEPLAAGTGLVFQNKSVGGVIPAVYIPAIEAGAREALQAGVFGFPILDIAITLVDGSTHSVDSSEFAFRQAARLAVRKMLENAKTQIFEPLTGVRVLTPETESAAVVRKIASLRGAVREVQPDLTCAREGWSKIQCILPLRAMPEFIRSARSQCHGNVLITNVELPESERYREHLS
jgi:elongation factor G